MLLSLFLTFLKIGLFTFGGGYAMISNIREGREVSDVEFVDNAQKEEFLRNQQHKLAKKSRARAKK